MSSIEIPADELYTLAWSKWTEYEEQFHAEYAEPFANIKEYYYKPTWFGLCKRKQITDDEIAVWYNKRFDPLDRHFNPLNTITRFKNCRQREIQPIIDLAEYALVHGIPTVTVSDKFAFLLK
jgi:hypothetical protein